MAKGFSLFGFKIGKDEKEVIPAFSPPILDDGAISIAAAANYGLSIDLETNYKSEIELITRYREMAMQPEIESAIDDIINEAVVFDIQNPSPVVIILDTLKAPEKVKKAISEEFNNILMLLNFKNLGADIFRRFYIDGRLYYNILIDQENISQGIQELRYVDPRKLTKIRSINKAKDPETGSDMVMGYTEYYIYSDSAGNKSSVNDQIGLKIASDSIIAITSGLMDAKRSIVLSYLHKGIRPLNVLRQMEDATVIYKLSRSSEKRIFYVDVGNLPKMKAEQYLRDLMTKYKNKVVLNAQTGEIVDNRKFISMQEDFWMPRRGEGRGTEITTLPSSGAFDDMSMVEYFEKKLYKALHVPFSRYNQPEAVFSTGESAAISRDEIKFAKFIKKLRQRFSDLFDQALRVQCIAKGICTPEEYEIYKQEFNYDWLQDNNYEEFKNAELLSSRINLLNSVDPYLGKYFDLSWVQHKILNMDNDEIEVIEKGIQKDIKNNVYVDNSLNVTLQKDQIENQQFEMQMNQQAMVNQQNMEDQAQEQPEPENTAAKGNPYYGK